MQLRLRGIIYFGAGHFISRVIIEDGQIWYHDGIVTGQAMEYEDTLDLAQINLATCYGKSHKSNILYIMLVLALYSVQRPINVENERKVERQTFE